MNGEGERRYSTRLPISRQVNLDFNEKIYEKCLVENLSLTGMFVQGIFEQEEGDNCLVNLVQEGKYSYLLLKAHAQIARKNDSGVALEFVSMPIESLMLLQMILHCENKAELYSNGVKSLDSLPFKVHDELP